MQVLRAVLLGAVWCALALPQVGLAQAPAPSEVSKPTVRELATRFVKQDAAELVGELSGMAERSVSERLKTYSAEHREWLAKAFAAAMSPVMADWLPEVEERLIEVYVARYSADDLAAVLDIQANMRQPHILAAIKKAELEAKPADQVKVLMAELPAEDFDRVMRGGTDRRVLDMVVITTELAEELSKDLVREQMPGVMRAMKAQCVSAPPGIAFCEGSGVSL